MPEYICEHPETGEQVTVLQSVHEEHVYNIDGVDYDNYSALIRLNHLILIKYTLIFQDKHCCDECWG